MFLNLRHRNCGAQFLDADRNTNKFVILNTIATITDVGTSVSTRFYSHFLDCIRGRCKVNDAGISNVAGIELVIMVGGWLGKI